MESPGQFSAEINRPPAKNERMDLLLHPSQHSGYVTRLFFERQIADRAANWTQHRVLETDWWAPSWNDVAPSLPWPGMRAPSGHRMSTLLKITAALLASIRTDLRRGHPFAHERVGFLSAGLAAAGDDVLILIRSYQPVADEDYLPDPTVGAMMGPEAIRKALQWAMSNGEALLHIHTHGGSGIPGFSHVDIRENAKFVPDFFKVSPQCLHGAVVLSDTAATGQVWLANNQPPAFIDRFVEVGAPLRKWGRA